MGLHARPMDNVADSVYWYSDNVKWQHMSGGINAGPVMGTDASSYAGIGPVTIPPGDYVQVAFAVVAGNSLDELNAGADAAQALFDAFIYGLDEDMSVVPEKFALHQNYPNPFNPVTVIPYDIPEASNVTIEIYNVLGQKVRSLVHKVHQPGKHLAKWNSRDDRGNLVTTGVYIYSVTAIDPATGKTVFNQAKKLVLIK